MNRSLFEVLDVPPALTTVTSTVVFAVPVGEVAVIEVSELIVRMPAGLEPKSTAVAPVKPEPLMFTCVPPVEAPWVGLIELTVAGGGR